MAAAMRGALSGSLVQFEDTLKALVVAGTVVAGYRPRGTQQQVFSWYRDAINLGLYKLNIDGGQVLIDSTPIPLLDT